MTLQATYLGAASIGASDLTPAIDTVYAVPVTVTSDGWLVSVEAAWRNGVMGAASGAVVYDDNGGQPGDIVAIRQIAAISRTLSADDRWITFPMFAWLTAGTYYVGTGAGSGGGGAVLRQTTGGSSGDGYTIDGNVNFTMPDGEYGSATVTATTATYSIRALIVEDTGGPTPPPSGGNRMGGDRAIRRSPVGR